MSTSMFRSKNIKPKKSVRSLAISQPLHLVKPPSPQQQQQRRISVDTTHNSIASCFESQDASTKQVVVLVSKYTFKAETENELSVEPNEFLMLLERYGDGWVKVQSLELTGRIGLVPASFLEISVNDPVHPITTEWLNEITDESNQTKQHELSVYPIDSKIERLFQNLDKQIWYLIQLTLNNSTIVYIGKRYHQFYNLHISLMELYPNSSLPKLPSPLSFCPQPAKLKHDKRFLTELKNTKKALNVYFKELITNHPNIQKSKPLNQFIFDDTFLRTSIHDKLDDEYLISSLHPESIELLKIGTFSISTFSATPPLSPKRERSQQKHELSCLIPDNSKYSTYISQDKKSLSHSTSAQTIQSYTSLIDRYDTQEEEEEDATEEQPDEEFSKNETDLNSERDANTSFSTHDSACSVVTKDSSIVSSGTDSLREGKFTRDSTNSSTCLPVDDVKIQALTPISVSSGKFSYDGNLEDPRHSIPVLNTNMTHKGGYAGGFSTAPSTPTTTSKKTWERLQSPNELAKNKLGENELIKLKFYLNNQEDDIVLLRIKRSNLISIVYLKKLLSYKIYKDYNLIDHYSLEPLPSQGLDPMKSPMNDEEMLEYIKAHSKVGFRLIRTR